MKIKLVNFKKHEDLTIDFFSGKVNYIDGDNGAGKSTIFEAILWVLYRRVRDISNWFDPSSHVCVYVEMDDKVLIYRQKKPKLLTVTFPDGRVIQNSVAQEYININYGQVDTWLATCYVKQGPYHPLLEYDPSSRMKLLNQVAFDGDDPSEKIEKIASAIRNTEINHARISSQTLMANNAYLDEVRMYPGISETWILSKEIDNQYRNEHQELSSSVLPNKRRQLNEASSIVGKFSAYESMIEISTTKINASEDIDTLKTRVTSMRESSAKYKVYLDSKNMHSQLTSKLNSLAHFPTNNLPNFTPVEIAELRRLKEEHSRNLNLSKSQQVEYSEISIEEKVKYLERLRDSQWMFNSANQVSQLSARISHLTNNLISLSSTSSIDANNEIAFINNANVEEATTCLTLTNGLSNKHNLSIVELNKNHERLLSLKSEELSSILLVSKSELLKEHDDTSLTNKEKELQLALTSVVASQHVHACPHCAGSLRVVNNKLERSDSTPYNQELHRELTELISRTKRSSEVFRSELSNKIYLLESENNLQTQSSRVAIITEIEKERQQLIAKYNSEIFILNDQLRRSKALKEARKAELLKLIASNSLYETQQSELNKLRAELSSVNSVNIPNDIRQLTHIEMSSINNSIVVLKGIKVIKELEVTVEQAAESAKWYIAEAVINELKEEIAKIVLVEVTLIDEKVISALANLISELEKARDNLKFAESELAKLGIKPDIIQLKEEISIAEQRIVFLANTLGKSERAQSAMVKYNTFLAKDYENNVVNKKLANLREMRRIAIETQSDVHYHLVTSINSFLATATPYLFDYPIAITVNTTKQDKIGKEISCVNLNISCRGNDNIKWEYLSGGEKREISTLLSLAFSGIFGGKLMILDESMACLSNNKKEAVMTLIKQVLSDRTVIITCHGIQKGIFDNVITI